MILRHIFIFLIFSLTACGTIYTQSPQTSYTKRSIPESTRQVLPENLQKLNGRPLARAMFQDALNSTAPGSKERKQVENALKRLDLLEAQ